MKRKLPILLFFILASCAPSGAMGTDWTQWRGPFLNGSSDALHLPEKWSATEGIAWVQPMPGAAGSTPVIFGDKVFATSLDKETKDLVALCFNRKDGKLLWSEVLGIGFGDEGRGRNMASPSPIADSERVYFLFGTTDFAAFDHDGKLLWKRNLQEDFGKFNILFGYHCTPLLYGGKLYVQVLQRDIPIQGPPPPGPPAESFLLALDPATGKDLWKVNRPTDAVLESHETYSTPMPYTWGNRPEILVLGGDCVTGHDPSNGAELWRWGSWNPAKISHWRIVPTLVASEGFIYVCTPKGSPVYAIKAGGVGQLDDAAIAWKLEKNTSDVCVPLLYGDRLYVLDGDKRVLTCMDPRSGAVKWAEELEGTASIKSSPTGADGKIYIIDEDGIVLVVAAGDEFRLISTIEMGEALCRSSIPVADGQLFIRTAENLYCVGEGK